MGNLILDSLEIRNFRNFEHLQIERLGRVNLIVGKNNVGKTSLLEALQIYAFRASFQSLLDILVKRKEIPLPYKNVNEMFLSLKYLFYGRGDMKPGLQPIQIGPRDGANGAVSIAVDWAITELDEQGTIHMRPLRAEDSYVLTNLTPRLVIRNSQQTVSVALTEGIPLNLLRLNAEVIHCLFIGASGLNSKQVAELWDTIALTELEGEVLAVLRILAPGVERLSIIGDAESRQERIPIVKIIGINEPVPLRNLGDGMQRILGVALALVNTKDGLLLVDDFENGLHYSVQSDLWRFIFRLAHHLNIQVFATTHSWDCIEGFQTAAQACKEDTEEESLLISLENRKSGVVAVPFNKEELRIVTRERVEVR